jgi:hypothetical protein
MKSPLLVSLALFAAGSAQAQSLTVVEASRAVAVQSFGHDWDFDDGLQLSDSTRSLSGPWQRSLLGDLDDWYDYDVAEALAVQDSDLSTLALRFLLTASADTAGNHFQADSSASSTFSARFDLAQFVRYRFGAQAHSTPGYNEARVRLAGASSPVHDLDGSYGGAQAANGCGWLVAGQYLLTGKAEAFAAGGSGSPDAQSGLARCAFEVFEAADYELDRDVDPADHAAFVADFLAGHPGADLDGDGSVEVADLRQFEELWKSAMND